MDQQRIEAYFNLIQQLLTHPNEVTEILQTNHELVDEGLLQIMEYSAQQLAENDDQNAQNAANFLRHLRSQLAEVLEISESPPSINYSSEDYLNFLMEALQATANSNNDPKVIYPLLQANLDKLDDNLANILRNWATARFSEVETDAAELLALIIGEFSNLIQQFPLGNKANNMEISIAGYEAIRKVFTRESNRENWAATQNNLANAYNNRIGGDKAENIESAIAASHLALSVYTKEDFPMQWAMTQDNLAIAYNNRIRGDKTENIESAIAAYLLALEVRTKQDFPMDWAMAQNSLGNAYGNRIIGEKAQNIESAIAAYQNALQIYNKTDFPTEWAMTQYNLGIEYQQRIKGEKAQNIESAIAAYQNALQVYTPIEFSKTWANTQYNLGIGYYQRIIGEKAQNIESAIAAYQNALKIFTSTGTPFNWAATQHNLGSAYKYRIKGEKAQNIESAIAAYQNALQVYTPQDFPTDWAMTQHNLGSVYGNRIIGEKAQNIESAIAAYQNALQIYNKTDFPTDWAMTQNSLGGGYYYRIRGDRIQNMKSAVAAFRNALQVYTPQDFPTDWAMTQHNLGTAYWRWSTTTGDKAWKIESAIAAFRNALLVKNPTDSPLEWAMTQNNLGNVYRDNRITGEKAQNIESAIAAYQNALQVYTPQYSPLEWAMTQNNLGLAYWEWSTITGEKAQNIESAIAAYQNALQVYTAQDFPIEWAMTQNNLGLAYGDRIIGEKAQNIESAIAAYQNAFQVRTPEADPIESFRTSRNLGDLHFEEGNWRPAIAAYEKAITAVELSRSWSTDDDHRQEILVAAIGVYQNIVQACVNTNQIEKALEYVERSRSRRLADLMASNDLYSQAEIPAEVKEWLEKHDAIQQQINQLWEQQQGDSHTEGRELAAATRGRAAMEARNESIAELEAQKQEVYKKIRSLDRVLAEGLEVTPLGFEQIQALIQQPTTAILSFYTTDDNTYLFVVRQNGVKVHIYSGLGFKKLQKWIEKNWFNSYLSSRSEWQQQMPGFLKEVASKLELEKLCKSDLKDIEELILIPHLYLHFLPWSAMPVGESGDKKYLGDYFRIRTLASCQILDFCTQRPKVEEVKAEEVKYGIVDDTRNDLPCSSYEAQQIAKMYKVPDKQRLRGEAATIDSYKLLLSQVKRLLSTHHAQSRTDNCMESALLLADGRITLGQLLSPAFRFPGLDEVFIDCCETNFALVQLSDDVLTLNTGFLCAGARGVISSLWSVDDLATCLFSIFYHQLRQNGKNRSEALPAAQQQLRELTGKELKKQYKQELEELLDQKLQEAYKQLEEAKVRRNSYAKDSAEYQEWEEKRKKHDNVCQRIYQTKNKYLPKACKLEHPFEHPAYWSAFICAGLS